MISPQDKSVLAKFSLVAQKIIYEPKRFKQFLQMMGTKEGAVQAVHTVIAAIEQIKPIPPQVRPYLGVNTYMLMIDVAQEVTGAQPDPAIVKEVTGIILSEAAAPKDAGMLAQMQEQGEPAAEEAQEAVEPPPAQDPGMLAAMQRRGVPA
jgi:hypothetical protein